MANKDDMRQVREGIERARDKVEAAKARAAEHEAAALRRIQQRINTIEMTPEEMLGLPARQQTFVETDGFAQTNMTPEGYDLLLPEERAMLARQRQQQQPRRMPQRLTEEFPGDDFTEETPQRQAAWSTKRFVAETRGGANIPVWKVVNSGGFSQEKLFRVEAVAEKVAALLNESGNMNDPRVVRVIGDYDKRDKILKEIRTLEKDAEGKPMKMERLKQLRGELTALDYRLGI